MARFKIGWRPNLALGNDTCQMPLVDDDPYYVPTMGYDQTV